jgi:hypothetical protein
VIIKFIKDLCNDNPVDYNFMFLWFAFILQNPAEIPGVMLVLQGSKGIGKNLLCDLLNLILGEVNCTSIADMDHLTGTFNDKRKDVKLVVLEEIGSSVYDPKNWGKMKDMITGSLQGFNGKHVAVEDSYAPSGFIQLTNDDDSVRVDTIQGTRRVWLIQCNNYWSRQECMVHGRMKEREDKFHRFIRQVFSDENGCVSAFAHYLYELPLKKNGDRYVKLEHYGFKCPALHEQAMRSLTIPAQMVVSWIEGNPVWTEETRYSEQEEARTVFKTEYEYGYLDVDQATWMPRDHVYSAYCRLFKEQKRGKPVSKQVFWCDLRQYVDVGSTGPERRVNGKTMRGLFFPSRRDMLIKFKQILPDYDYKFEVCYDS